MKIVLTGANGFIGSNLCNYLSKKYQVLALSRNSNNLDVNDNLKYFQYNLENIEDCEKEILQFDPDVVINCAWIGGNKFDDTCSMIQFENLQYGIKLLDIIKKSNTNLFVSLGTAAEYGYYTQQVSENHIQNPYSLYGQTKKYFYDICKNICDLNKINFSWIIPFHVYGPNDVKTRIIPKVIDLSLKNEDFTLNSCDTLADYLYIDDFVQGVEQIIQHNVTGKINLCSGKTYQIKDIVNFIVKNCNFESNVYFDSTLDRQNFQKYFCGNNNKIVSMTDWKEKYTLEQGLINTIERFKNVTRF